jgi:hypothetical protein
MKTDAALSLSRLARHRFAEHLRECAASKSRRLLFAAARSIALAKKEAEKVIRRLARPRRCADDSAIVFAKHLQ